MPAKRSDNLALPGSSSIPINLSFGNFEFDEIKRTGQRGGGVRELSRSLRRAQQRAALHTQLLYTPGGVEERNAELLDTATRRAAGEKVKDDPKRLAKALARRRNKKRRSAKKWTRRMEQLKQSVDDVLEERARKRKAGRRTM
ncbi:putative Surfeit locus protein 6 [Trypanosoma vivax]|nr:putative Surfeit locus protein 6 [Trypanosoma vivax]